MLEGKWTTDPEVLASKLEDQSGLRGEAVALVRPESTDEVVEVVRRCRAEGLALLPVGLQSATTGAAVPCGGVLLDTSAMKGVIDVDEDGLTARVRSGTVTADLKRIVAGLGLDYAPDPTSERESTLGGNAASNASGARSYRYGMTRNWVTALEVVDGAGRVLRLQRCAVDKNTIGPHAFQDPVDLFIGSEGIFGVITEVTVRLQPAPPPFFSALLFFRELRQAVAAAAELRLRDGVHRMSGGDWRSPRCVELFDAEALKIMATHPRCPRLPAEAGAMLFTEWDCGDGSGVDSVTRLLPLWEELSARVDDSILCFERCEKELLRELRHHIPETCNSLAASARASGGLKVSTEFCVPPSQITRIMDFVEETREGTGLHHMVRYGHIGNGHPHIFMYARSGEEQPFIRGLAHRLCAKAVELGGTIAGEHGIGKTRRDFLGYMLPPQVIEALAGAKAALDPDWIMAPGNILPSRRKERSPLAGNGS